MELFPLPLLGESVRSRAADNSKVTFVPIQPEWLESMEQEKGVNNEPLLHWTPRGV